MYVSLSRLRIPEHGAPGLIAAFGARAHLVDDADGFIDLLDECDEYRRAGVFG
jgi:heme-degrading monooxygenase HmoA